MRRTIESCLWTDNKTVPGARNFSIYCITEDGLEKTGPCKIGIATNLNKRLSSLQGGNWRRLVLVWQICISDRDEAKTVEKYCLSCLRPSIYSLTNTPRLQSEWINKPPFKILEIALRHLNAEHERIRRVA